MLAMGDILRESVVGPSGVHSVRGLPVRGLYGLPGAATLPAVTSVQEAFPYNTNSTLQLVADHGDAPPDYGARLPCRRTRGPRRWRYNDGPSARATTTAWCRITTTAGWNALSRSSITHATSNSRGYTRRRSAKAGTGTSANSTTSSAAGNWPQSTITGPATRSTCTPPGLDVPAGFAPNIRPDILSGVPTDPGRRALQRRFANGTPYLNPAAFQNVPSTGERCAIASRDGATHYRRAARTAFVVRAVPDGQEVPDSRSGRP